MDKVPQLVPKNYRRSWFVQIAHAIGIQRGGLGVDYHGFPSFVERRI